MGALGERMKALEYTTRTVLPRHTNMVIRVDGRAFHSFTRGLERPFDPGFIHAMDQTALALCQEVQGAVCAYVQSDEISVIATDYAGSNAEAWLGGVHAKIVSLSASHATAVFNRALPREWEFATFDSRAFTVPFTSDLTDYLLWRQHDARRNAVGMICDRYIGHKPTIGVKYAERVEMLRQKDITLDMFPQGCIEGRFITSERVLGDVEYTHKRTGELHVAKDVLRRVWKIEDAPDFRWPSHLLDLLPTLEES
jgi:hypothetical protein